eukprot:TRINITY_DN8543_c0_g1_i1.p1 TRINITY_DN8543_c0_g1~~TRINITY_DN8543_c0_g1_i1.p1  ORF type:complete len:340 (+),score=94.11 TRINITY_DN8543_c0_g1_i1:40-1059(+)
MGSGSSASAKEAFADASADELKQACGLLTEDQRLRLNSAMATLSESIVAQGIASKVDEPVISDQAKLDDSCRAMTPSTAAPMTPKSGLAGEEESAHFPLLDAIQKDGFAQTTAVPDAALPAESAIQPPLEAPLSHQESREQKGDNSDVAQACQASTVLDAAMPADAADQPSLKESLSHQASAEQKGEHSNDVQIQGDLTMGSSAEPQCSDPQQASADADDNTLAEASQEPAVEAAANNETLEEALEQPAVREPFPVLASSRPSGPPPENIQKAAFESIDKNNSGYIEPDEFDAVLREMKTTLTDEEIQLAFKAADVDADNKLSFSEYAAFLQRAFDSTA